MNKLTIVETALVLFGIYCFILFVSSIPGIGMTIITSGSRTVSNPVLYVAMPCLLSGLYLLLSGIMIGWNRPISRLLVPEDKEKFADHSSESKAVSGMSIAIALIGIYYFVSSAGALLSNAVVLSLEPKGIYWISRIIADLGTLIFSVILVVWNKRIDLLIKR